MGRNSCPMTALAYYLYTDIPGAGKGWTLAVLATSQQDARTYVNNYNHGGRYVGKVDHPGATVKADCGAVTPAAEAQLHS